MNLALVTNEDILREVFRGMPDDERAVMCSLSGDPSVAGSREWVGIAWQNNTRCPLIPNRNNYVAVSGFNVAEDKRWRRRKENFAGLYALMIDDVGTKVAHSRLPPIPAPSMAVETSPGNYQVAYLLDRPMRIGDMAEDAIIQVIKTLTGGGLDPGMAGITRVMRLPHGVNGKPKYATDGEPWHCKLAYWRPDIRCSWDDLCRGFGIVSRTRVYNTLPQDAVAHERVRSFSLVKQGLEHLRIIKRQGKAWIEIRCPWVADHTDRSNTGAAVAIPMPANGFFGAYRCHHGHCADKGWAELENWVFDEVIREGRQMRKPFYRADQ